VLLVVSSAVLLSVRSSLITVGFGPSSQLLSLVAFRFAMMVKTAVGRGRRREKEGGRSGKACVADQTADMTETGFHAPKYLSAGSTRARRSGCAGAQK